MEFQLANIVGAKVECEHGHYTRWSGSYEYKTLFNEISVDVKNMLYRTQNKNVFIEYIQDLTGDNGQTKKRNSELKFNYSALVEAIRLLSNL